MRQDASGFGSYRPENGEESDRWKKSETRGREYFRSIVSLRFRRRRADTVDADVGMLLAVKFAKTSSYSCQIFGQIF